MVKRRARRERTRPASIGVCVFLLALFGGLGTFFVVVGVDLVSVLIDAGAGEVVGVARPTPVWFALIGLALAMAFCAQQAIDAPRGLVVAVKARRSAGARHP